MTAPKHLLILILSGLALSGCLSSNKEPKDSPLPLEQQNNYLSKARPPQQFGFSIFPSKGGMAYSGSARLHPNHFVSVKMIEDGIPAIKTRGRSKRNTMNVLVDISSPISWMEFSTSQKFGTHFMGINDEVIPYRGSYNTGGVNAYAGVLTQLRIENLFMENVPFYIRMSIGSLGPLARGIREPEIDAILGYDNLRDFEYIQFDLQNNKINFSSTTPYKPHQGLSVHTAKIIKSRSYGLVVDGQIGDQPGPVVLDLAGNYDFSRGDVKVSTTKLVQVGDLSFTNAPTLVLPVHDSPPRVGRKLLAPYLITVCNKEGVVYFERFPEKD